METSASLLANRTEWPRAHREKKFKLCSLQNRLQFERNSWLKEGLEG